MAKIATKHCSLPLHIIRALFYLTLTFVLTSLFCGNLFALTGDYKAPLEALFASEPEQMASALGDENTSHPLLRHFQPISGQFSFSAIDLQANGAQPVALERIFLAPQIAGSYA